MISEVDLGWLAGILEGEGCFAINSYTPIVQIEMTDEDVVHRVASVMERVIGRPVKVYCGNGSRLIATNRQETYAIKLCGDSARIVMSLIVRLMGKRRRQKIWQVLNGHKPKPIPMKQVKDLISNIVYMRKP